MTRHSLASLVLVSLCWLAAAINPCLLLNQWPGSGGSRDGATLLLSHVSALHRSGVIQNWAIEQALAPLVLEARKRMSCPVSAPLAVAPAGDDTGRQWARDLFPAHAVADGLREYRKPSGDCRIRPRQLAPPSSPAPASPPLRSKRADSRHVVQECKLSAGGLLQMC